MNNEQKLLVEKAQESLKASKILLENELLDFATARAYYTMFYIAEAFLLKQGLTPILTFFLISKNNFVG